MYIFKCMNRLICPPVFFFNMKQKEVGVKLRKVSIAVLGRSVTITADTNAKETNTQPELGMQISFYQLER